MTAGFVKVSQKFATTKIKIIYIMQRMVSFLCSYDSIRIVKKALKVFKHYYGWSKTKFLHFIFVLHTFWLALFAQN